MVRTGDSFTAEEIESMEYLEKMSPETHEWDARQWRSFFDDSKRVRLSSMIGLDEKIQSGVFRVTESVSAERIRSDCTNIMYAQTKARVFNILESQFDEGTRLKAVKRAVEDILSSVSDNIDTYLMRSLIDGYKISE